MKSDNYYNKEKNNLNTRLFQFAVDIIGLVRKLPKGNEYNIISNQLIKAATSSGANYEESPAAVSRADFSNKIGISLKEMRGSNYWIKLVNAMSNENSEWINIEKESVELKNILGSIYAKTSKHRE